jgi:hypothetical protein
MCTKFSYFSMQVKLSAAFIGSEVFLVVEQASPTCSPPSWPRWVSGPASGYRSLSWTRQTSPRPGPPWSSEVLRYVRPVCVNICTVYQCCVARAPRSRNFWLEPKASRNKFPLRILALSPVQTKKESHTSTFIYNESIIWKEKKFTLVLIYAEIFSSIGATFASRGEGLSR